MDPLAADDPHEIGLYRLEGRLGAGGTGRVYLGRSRGGRPVAVKVVRPELAGDKGFRRRFAQEVAAARKVNAFYTAPMIDADPEGDPPWLATAYVPGPSLRTAVEETGPLPVLTYAATGRSPFGTGAPEAVLFRVVHGEPDLTGVPDELTDLLAACLAKDPERRPGAARLLDGFNGSASHRTGGGRTADAEDGANEEATAHLHAGTTERVPPPSPTRVQPTASFTLTGKPVGGMPARATSASGR